MSEIKVEQSTNFVVWLPTGQVVLDLNQLIQLQHQVNKAVMGAIGYKVGDFIPKYSPEPARNLILEDSDGDKLKWDEGRQGWRYDFSNNVSSWDERTEIYAFTVVDTV